MCARRRPPGAADELPSVQIRELAVHAQRVDLAVPARQRELVLTIDPQLYPLIQGSTDSEVLFYLALTFGLADDPIRGMRDAIRTVETVGRAAGVTHPV